LTSSSRTATNNRANRVIVKGISNKENGGRSSIFSTGEDGVLIFHEEVISDGHSLEGFQFNGRSRRSGSRNSVGFKARILNSNHGLVSSFGIRRSRSNTNSTSISSKVVLEVAVINQSIRIP